MRSFKNVLQPRFPSSGQLIQVLVGMMLVVAVGLAVFRFGAPPPTESAPPTQGAHPDQNAQKHIMVAPAAPTGREPMPTAAISGWREVFSDDFPGRSLDLTKWRLYYGIPGGDPAGWYDPSHVSVSNGMLVIGAYKDPADGGKWATGGLSSSLGLAQTYGKYLVRFRFDAGIGVGHAILLWPADNTWPPEIDFSEDNGSGRDSTLATLHYGAKDHHLVGKILVNLTQWHTIGVEWTPGRLVYTLDGRGWFNLVGNAVPAIPMVLDMQTETWPCRGTWGRCPDSSTPRAVRLEVDWVVAYALTSRLVRRPQSGRPGG